MVGGYAYQTVGGTNIPFAVYSDPGMAADMLMLLDSTGNAVPGFPKAVVETTAGGMFGGYRNEVYTMEVGGGTAACVYPAGAFIYPPGEACDTADNVWGRLNPSISLPTSITAIDKFVIDPADSSHMMWIMNQGTMMTEPNNPYTLPGYDSGVPEPATWALDGIGLVGFALWRGRRAFQRGSR